MTSEEYWAKRAERQQAALAERSAANIERQLKKYYATAQKRVIKDFEATFDKLLAAVVQGRAPTPADLYKLDKYWEMQAALKKELQKLGDKEAALLSDHFIKTWQAAYNAAAMPSDIAYINISTANARQMINNIWCADGKTWSQRIWKNTERLTQTLNENLVHCVVTGKKTTELKRLLQERFSVSYGQADALVRTEIAHIQTRAAAQRYKDYGLQKYRFLGREEKDGCGHSPDCHELNGKEFFYAEMKEGINAPPMHPRCKCCIVPVVEKTIKQAAPAENSAKTDNAYQQRIIERRNAYRNKQKGGPNFETMSKADVIAWSKSNLKTSVDFKGAGENAARIVTKALHDIESKGFDLKDVKVVFGGASRGAMAEFDSRTKTIYMKNNASAKTLEMMKKADARSMDKFGRPFNAVSSYRGVITHEVGHALDYLNNYSLSQTIAAKDELFIKSLKISHTASYRDVNHNRATETFAENFSAYMEGGETAKKVPQEVNDMLDDLIKKQKKQLKKDNGL